MGLCCLFQTGGICVACFRRVEFVLPVSDGWNLCCLFQTGGVCVVCFRRVGFVLPLLGTVARAIVFLLVLGSGASVYYIYIGTVMEGQ